MYDFSHPILRTQEKLTEAEIEWENVSIEQTHYRFIPPQYFYRIKIKNIGVPFAIPIESNLDLSLPFIKSEIKRYRERSTIG
jgi:hypothetical protein